MTVSPEPNGKTAKITVAVLTKCMLSHNGLINTLAKDNQISVLDSISTFDSFSALTIKPDIILICWSTLCDIGIDDLKKINQKYPNIKFIIYNVDPKEEKIIIRFLKFGIMGIIHKGDDQSILGNAIKKVHCGELWITRKNILTLLREGYKSQDIDDNFEKLKGSLTKREVEIFDLITRGHRNKEIGNRLNIKENTVKYHIQNIFKKLGCKNRLQTILTTSKESLE